VSRGGFGAGRPRASGPLPVARGGRRVGCRVRAVTCPTSRLSGCEAGHAGVRVVPGCPPVPTPRVSPFTWCRRRHRSSG
jgi:hypothetical protein